MGLSVFGVWSLVCGFESLGLWSVGLRVLGVWCLVCGVESFSCMVSGLWG